MTSHDDIPDRLAEGLRQLHAGPQPPADLNRRVLAAARREMAPRPLVLKPKPWLAAAAALALGVTAWVLVPRPGTPGPMAAAAIDASGDIDILDAFMIARALRDDAPTDPTWDLNADGVIDDTDVDVAAMLSVRLEGEAS